MTDRLSMVVLLASALLVAACSNGGAGFQGNAHSSKKKSNVVRDGGVTPAASADAAPVRTDDELIVFASDSTPKSFTGKAWRERVAPKWMALNALDLVASDPVAQTDGRLQTMFAKMGNLPHYTTPDDVEAVRRDYPQLFAAEGATFSAADAKAAAAKIRQGLLKQVVITDADENGLGLSDGTLTMSEQDSIDRFQAIYERQLDDDAKVAAENAAIEAKAASDKVAADNAIKAQQEAQRKLDLEKAELAKAAVIAQQKLDLAAATPAPAPAPAPAPQPVAQKPLIPKGCFRIGGTGYWSNGQGQSCAFLGPTLQGHCGTTNFYDLQEYGDQQGNKDVGACHD